MTHTCGRCDQTWTATRAAHCGGCHRTFSTVSNFDRHRKGGGACLPPEVIGLRQVDNMWTGEPRPEGTWAA